MRPRTPRAPSRWTCAWPDCRRRVGDTKAFCRAHWRLVPEQEREATVKSVFAARDRLQLVSARFITEPTEEWPKGSQCPVHGRVHSAHGWYVCVPE